MESTLRRPQLPSLTYPDVERTKSDEDSLQCLRNAIPPSLSTAASPTHHYPPGPYSLYGHHPSTLPPAHPSTTMTTHGSGIHTPPESRRTSEQERGGIKQSWQSLPSISEALGVNSKTTFAPVNAPPTILQSQHPPQLPAVPSPASPNPRRSYPTETAQGNPLAPAAGHYPHSSQYLSDPPSHSYPPSVLPDSSRPASAYHISSDVEGPLHSQTPPSRSLPSRALSRTAEPPSPCEPSQQAGSMPPPSTFPYGYSPYPPRYAHPTPPSSVSSSSLYQPSPAYGPQPVSSDRKTEGPPRYDDRPPGPANYGENVKRHLDLYDLETSLNEISSTSGIITDFSRRYGDRMHQTQRSGTTLSSLPGIVEVDDMIAKTRAQHDSLLKIRDVVLTKQAVYDQQVADQRHQHNAFGEALAPQTEHLPADSDESRTGGFAGSDTKKRRGRAAPPGRCHSCNRAETPEWRRGPDGARTLCNACGLHYAKLTRKNNGGSKNTVVAGSSLRPKENLPH